VDVSSARSLTNIANIDAGYLAVFVVLYAPALLAVKQGYEAPDALRARYATRLAAKRGLTTDHILPEMVNLVIDVNTRARDPRYDPPEVLTDRGIISGTLDSAGYLGRVETFSRLYFEYGQFDALFDGCVRWARRKAWFAAALAIALVPLTARYGFGVSAIPNGAVLLDAAVALVLATLSAVCWWQDASGRNRLSALCEKYG
jgi:hypothetical protein